MTTKLLLAALAGKAALRLSRSTGRLARTIFRTLRELDEREAIENQPAGELEQSVRAELEAKLRDLAQLAPDTLVLAGMSAPSWRAPQAQLRFGRKVTGETQ
jgi:exodeoxyribonuclease V alpha subunit